MGDEAKTMPIRTWMICVALIFVVANGRAGEQPRAVLPPSAPDFTLPDLHGQAFRLKEMPGQMIVLNFWAFWCDTWKDELPHLTELVKEQSDRDFRLVAVSVDGTRLQEFMDKTKGAVSFPVLLDAGGKVSESYKVFHVPTVVILDSAHRIRYVKTGYPGNEAIRTVLRKLQSEKSKDLKPGTPSPGN